jgi:C-terminal processing protease CtpA/Prc
MVKVPGFFGLDSEQGKRYATKIQEIIGRLGKNQPDGWIVDLRENNGGNLWPMLAGLGPLLGAETVGGFKTPGSDEVEKWKYKDGKSSIGSMLTCESNHVHAPIGAQVPMAVLTGPMTGSAGEALVIAFSGRSNTRTFGRETLGVPFANKTYILPDGSQLLIAAQYLVNRNGKVVENGTIKPDEQVEDSRVIASASRWINDNSPLSLNTTFFER